MRRLSRIFSTLVVTGMLAAFGIVGGAGSALAYGAPEQPLAQIELSANCNNLDHPLCQPRPRHLGEGNNSSRRFSLLDRPNEHLLPGQLAVWRRHSLSSDCWSLF